MSDNQGLHVVFGASGGAGNALVRALAAQGKRIRAVNRGGNAVVPEGVERMKGDAGNLASAKAACEGAAVVYHCVNVPYNKWPEMFPPVMESLIEAAAGANAKLIYADNFYMYGKVNGPMKPTEDYNPCSRKGELRAQLATMLMDAHRSGKVRATIGRASDFYGPGVINAGMGEMVFGPAIAGKSANVLGDVDMPHVYTYIDDFAKGLTTLGEREEALGKVWHTPNAPAILSRELLTMIYEAAGHPTQFRSAPGFILTLMGLFNPVIREVKEMIYQFEMPFEVDHSEYDRVFGDVTPTSYQDGVQTTMAWFRHR